jgi:hypothetical protein
MSEVDVAPNSGMEAQARNHSFKVSGDVCAGCHEATIHSSSKLASVGGATNAGADSAAGTLEEEIARLKSRLDTVRNMGLATAGLALGFGGFVGLLMGIIGMSLWQRKDS